jgi:small subunit ribosomal protein S5
MTEQEIKLEKKVEEKKDDLAETPKEENQSTGSDKSNDDKQVGSGDKGTTSKQAESSDSSVNKKEEGVQNKTNAPEEREVRGGRGGGRFRGRPPRKTPEELLAEHLGSWVPKTNLGRLVRDGKIKKLDDILDKNLKILESEVVDTLLRVENDLLFSGQAKGKFGGGKRRAWRQSQKKTKEGNVITFSALAVVGDRDGHIGLGFGKAKETLPAREKALRKAKIGIMRIKRGSGSFDGSSSELHSIPFRVEGKCGSVRIKLMPAPQGTGLVIGNEGKKILQLAGIKDIYSKSYGQTGTTLNYAKAIMDALGKLK